MGCGVVVTPELVRQEWEQLESWSPVRAAREARQFIQRQPAVTAYVCALLEEQGLAATSFGLELAHTVERVYRRTLGGTPVSVSEHDVEIAAEETEKRFADLACGLHVPPRAGENPQGNLC